jgi:maltoporin
MAYIGTVPVDTKPTYVVEIGTGLVTIPNTQSNVLHFDTAYLSFVNINVDTTTTLVATNNYYIVGDITIADTKTWDVAGTGTLNVV